MEKHCLQCNRVLNNFQNKINCFDFIGDEYSYHQCPECKVFSIHPMPSSEQLNNAYSEQYYGENNTKFNPIIEAFINKMRFRKADRLRKLISRGGRVLDIGCGNGAFLNYLNKQNEFEIHGLEIPGKSAERAAKVPDLNLALTTFEDFSAEEKSFDLITIIHVIEHLPNVWTALKKMDVLLKKEGLIYLGFPNIESKQAQKYQGDWLHLDPPRHLNFIPPKVLKEWAMNNGFEVIYENHYSLEYNPFGEVQSWLNQNCSQRDFLFEKLKGNKQIGNLAKEVSSVQQFLKGGIYAPFAAAKSFLQARKKSGGCVEFILKKK